MTNSEVKGTLARLLATENLTVEHRKVSTASFDVNNRVLVLPIWKTASNTVYDLLVGHEVGHALYTPNIPVDAPKAFVNVIEDARIERMMKITYPGLRKSFFEGYRELWHQDFFGVADTDINSMSFIDRINLYFKGCVDLEFTDEEQVYVDRVGKTNTFQDVIDLSNELYGYAKSKEDEKENVAQTEELDDLDFDLDLPQDTDEQNEVTPDEEEGDNQEKEGRPDLGDDTTEYEKPEPADLDTPSYDQGGEECDELKSQTEEALRQALETLVDDDAKEWVYLNTPDINLDKVITPYQTIQDDLYYFFEGKAVSIDQQHEQRWWKTSLEDAVQNYLTAKKESQRSVSYLVKQFEMRKSADEYKRAAVSKTGVINTNSLFKYKITDDIFKRVTTVKEGKNHGLVMFLDWSGSMQYQLIDTLMQTYNLIWFCKKAGIPFRVYAFQNAYASSGEVHPGIKNPKDRTLGLCGDFRLLEFFSSRQNTKSLEKSMKYVYCQAHGMGRGGLGYMHEYTLGGTPLAEAIICAPAIVDRLRKTENVQKVNVVSLTDGEANPITYLKERNPDDWYPYNEDRDFLNKSIQYSSRLTKFMLRDSKTGYTREISPSPYETTKEIVSFYREITDYNWVGIRICSKNELKRFLRTLTYEESEVIDKQWKRERFASVKKNAGFTESFYIADKSLGGGTEDLEVKQKGQVATRAELGRAFKKHMGSKMTNKKVLNAFIEQIA